MFTSPFEPVKSIAATRFKLNPLFRKSINVGIVINLQSWSVRSPAFFIFGLFKGNSVGGFNVFS